MRDCGRLRNEGVARCSVCLRISAQKDGPRVQCRNDCLPHSLLLGFLPHLALHSVCLQNAKSAGEFQRSQVYRIYNVRIYSKRFRWMSNFRYCTLVIFIAFLVLHVGTSYKALVMSFSCSISATVALVLLFFPKIYIIILHPERNVRASYTTTKLIRYEIHDWIDQVWWWVSDAISATPRERMIVRSRVSTCHQRPHGLRCSRALSGWISMTTRACSIVPGFQTYLHCLMLINNQYKSNRGTRKGQNR